MREKKGDYVVINHSYVILHDGEGRGVAIEVYDNSSAKKRSEEIRKFIKNCPGSSGGGGYIKVGKTPFNYSSLGLFDRKAKRIVILKNNKTNEYFLVMDETVSIKQAEKFIEKVNTTRNKGKDLTKYTFLKFPITKVNAPMGEMGGDTYITFMHTFVGILIGQLVIR